MSATGSLRRPDLPLPPPPPWLFLQAALVFIGCAALYFLTRTPALDEWDSVQFALGVGDFDLWKHQPHPPGYPLYIAAGWLFSHALRLPIPDALHLVSALGGGLFVACWFALAARHFGRAAAWTLAVALATLLITWMSATKVLSDPLATGLLSLTLLLADRCRRVSVENAVPRLAALALAGAAATGARPQNFGVVLLIVCLATAACRPILPLPHGRRWAVALGVLVGGCLLWLLPTMFLQARAPEAGGDWLAYPKLLTLQWRWRLDQPKAFVAAVNTVGDDPGENLWLYRLEHHPLGWLTRGFGFALDSAWGWVGVMILASGWGLFLRQKADSSPREIARRVITQKAEGGWQRERTPFWREQWPWAVAYVLMIFCFLPGDQRYYLPIFPLLILPAVLGWRSLERRWHWAGWLVPVTTLATTLPFVGPNHADPAPPVRLVRWLQAQYPPAERAKVWVYVRDTHRHFQWYAPEFHLVGLEFPLADAVPPPGVAAYTDDPAFAAHFPAARQVAHFERSPLIYRKHHEDVLYRINDE